MAQLVATPLSRIEPVAIRWLWPGYIPRGKLVLLDGDPGLGKSLVTLDLAARLSRGSPLPDGSPSHQPHTMLLIAGEDDAADTIRPRAEAAGADLDRLIAITGGTGGSLRFPRDLPELDSLAREHRPDLIVLDPVMAFLPGEVAANSEQCVRPVLERLAGFAEEHDAAILMIRHLRKRGAAKALYRGAGSVGFIAAVRAGLYAAVHPDDAGQLVLAPMKLNLAEAGPALGYRIAGAENGGAVVNWSGPVAVDANDLDGKPEPALRPRDRASGWLMRQLADGPVKSVILYEQAAAEGIPNRTLERAKDELGFRSYQLGKKGAQKEWY